MHLVQINQVKILTILCDTTSCVMYLAYSFEQVWCILLPYEFFNIEQFKPFCMHLNCS
jgi:hypothetical protein